MDHLELERVKRRIRGLLNLASDSSAAEGEIDNAMRMASELMNQHHLQEAEVMASSSADSARKEEVMGRASATVHGSKFSSWESTLSAAIEKLVGSVKRYRDRAEATEGTFGRPVVKPAIFYYWPIEDAQMACELFREWSLTIATMSVGKYGGCFKGDGAMYADGFSRELYSKSIECERSRQKLITSATSAIVKIEGGSLAQVLEGKRNRARHWIENVVGIKLVKGSRGGGYSSGSHDAYSHGRRDGSRAEFSATRRPAQKRLA